MKISAIHQELVNMWKVVRKQLPGIFQVIPPCACTDSQEELLPAPLENQGLWKTQILMLLNTHRGVGGLIYYGCALG